MLRSLSIRLRLTVGFATLLVCLCAIAAASLAGFQYLNEQMRVVYEERAIPVELLSQVNYLMQRNRVLMMDTLVDPGKSNLEKRKSEFVSNAAKIGNALQQFAAIPRPADLEEPYRAFLEQQSKYGTQALGAAMEAMANDKFDDGQALYLDKVGPMAPAFQASIEKLMDLQIKWAGNTYEAARGSAATGRFVTLVLVLSALAGGVLLSWLIARSITRPVMDAENIATRVAQGDLRPAEIEPGNDEVGRLLAQLERMRLGLSRIVADVRGGSNSIAGTSGEIAGGVNDLSRRTELQAANLQEASAGLDQLLRGVQSHMQIFGEVSKLARTTESGAKQGGQSVQELVVRIEAVGEKSRKIAAITDVIDGIAFQTNILALNAAVEAARAGEQGRGFAVVASEVRMLATRSATAAAEIRTLISDTVDSVTQVTSQAISAGDAVGGVVAQVSTINDLIGRLNETSSHQAEELTQISQAIHSIDEMTQQNAALVEENAAVAERLASDATGLDRMVGTFQLS